MRLVDLEVHVTGGRDCATRASGVPAPAGTTSGSTPTGTASSRSGRNSTPQGLRLTSFKSKLVGGQLRYFGVWGPGNDGHYLWGNVSWDSFRAKWEEAERPELAARRPEHRGRRRRGALLRRLARRHGRPLPLGERRLEQFRRQVAGTGAAGPAPDGHRQSHRSTGSDGTPVCGDPERMAITSGATRAGRTSWPSGANWPIANSG